MRRYTMNDMRGNIPTSIVNMMSLQVASADIIACGTMFRQNKDINN